MKDLTEEEAIKLAESGFWKDMTSRQIAEFQFYTDRLCMPFEVFHEALEKTLGRSVYTHELGKNNLDNIEKELRGEKSKPTFQEILDLIPIEKRVVIKLGDG